MPLLLQAPRPSPSELPGCRCSRSCSSLLSASRQRSTFRKTAQRSSESGFSGKDLSQLLAGALRAGELERAAPCRKVVLVPISGGHYQDQRFVFNRAAQLREMLAEAGLLPCAQEVPLAEHLEKLEDIGTSTRAVYAVVSLKQLNAAGKRRQRLDSIVAQVAHRIEVGYKTADCRLQKIADEMGLSNAYLSCMFRELTRCRSANTRTIHASNAPGALLENGALNVEAVGGKKRALKIPNIFMSS